MLENNNQGWKEWSKYVLKELERLNECYEKLDTKMNDIATDISVLKVKAGIWGLVGAAIPVTALLILQYLKK
jgi:hypothetical protein